MVVVGMVGAASGWSYPIGPVDYLSEWCVDRLGPELRGCKMRGPSCPGLRDTIVCLLLVLCFFSLYHDNPVGYNCSKHFIVLQKENLEHLNFSSHFPC